MTIPRDHAHADDALPQSLQRRLQALRQPAPPARDLWPAIEGRLGTAGARAAGARRAPARRPRRRLAWLAVAASLVLAAGVGLRLQTVTPVGPGSVATAPARAEPSPAMLERQADAMTVEYAAALREVQAARPGPGDAGVLAELDGSATAIRAALADQPDARYLLEQLRRVYARRLDITRRLA